MSRKNKKYKLAAPKTSEQKAATRRVLNYNLKSVSRCRQDIQSWNRALNMMQNADEPRSYPLQLLYEEILHDALLTSQIENRKQQVFSSAFTLKGANGEDDVEAVKAFKNLCIYRPMTNSVLDATYKGYTLVEQSLGKNILGNTIVKVDTIPRTNVVPQKGLFYPDYGDDIKKIPYRELAEYGTWILEFDSGHFGLLNKAVPHVLFKRFAQSCWSELCEIYGIPPRVLKTNTQDSSMLRRGEQMMKDMGAAAYFIIDEMETIEFAQGVSTNGDVYKNLITYCDQMLSLLINGAVMGQDTEHGNRSKELASQETQWLLVQADMEMLEETWNNTILPALVKIGVMKPGLTFEFQPAEDTNQLFKFTSGLLTHYDIAPEWIKEKFGVEVTAKIKPDPSGTDNDPKGEKLSFFGQAPAAMTGAAKTCCGNHLTLAALPNNFDDDALIKRFWDGQGQLTFDAGLFLHTADVLSKGFKKGWNEGREIKLAVGIEFGKDDPALLTAYEMNLFRFSAAKTLAEAQELNRLFRQAKSFDQFYLNAKAKVDVFNKTWLETEYNTAMLVGTSASTYNRLMGSAKTFPYWEYKTVGDNAVRPAHRKLDGIILPYNDPRWKKLFPPNDWNCRCYIVPRMKHEVEGLNLAAMRARADEYLESPEWKKAHAQGWGVNRGDTNEVFTANQFYIAKFPGSAAKKLNDLGPSQFGLPSYSQAKAKAKTDTPVYSGEAADFYKGLEELNGNRVLRDYNNRPIEFTTATLTSHTTGNKEDRVKYMEAMADALKKPDEVWIKGKELEDMSYIKYYKDGTVVVASKIKKGVVSRIATWFPLAEAKRAINNWRKGLNIFGKK